MKLRLRNLKNRRVVAALAGIILLVLLSLSIPALRSPVLSILENPLSIFTMIKREIGGIIFYHKNMVDSERLRNEAGFLRTKLLTAREAVMENGRLKGIISFKQKSPFKVVVAKVIGRSPDSWTSVVIIDKGKKSGIRRGFIAVTYSGLAGRVIEANESTSKVMLINDPNLAVSSIVSRSRQEGLVSGTLGSSLIMKYLPKDADIELSDEIITSGLTENFPKAILIGKVVEVGDEFSGLSKYAIIKPEVNLSSLEEVMIIIP